MHLGNTAQIYQNIYYGGLRIIRAYPKSSRCLPIEKAAHKGRLFNGSGQWDWLPQVAARALISSADRHTSVCLELVVGPLFRGSESSRRLPIEKAAHKGRLFNWSGQWDSDPRHQPWQGCALPLSYTRII